MCHDGKLVKVDGRNHSPNLGVYLIGLTIAVAPVRFRPARRGAVETNQNPITRR